MYIILQAATRAFPDIQVQRPAAVPLWAIILSICIGILLLLLIILLLCKVYERRFTFHEIHLLVISTFTVTVMSCNPSVILLLSKVTGKNEGLHRGQKVTTGGKN